MRESIVKRFNALKNHPNRALRISAGVLLIVGGLLGVLPVLGFWMLPLGLILLSVDFEWAKRAHVNLRLLWRKMRPPWRQRPVAERDDRGDGVTAGARKPPDDDHSPSLR